MPRAEWLVCRAEQTGRRRTVTLRWGSVVGCVRAHFGGDLRGAGMT